MKKIFSIFAIAGVFTACNTNPETSSNKINTPVVTDSSALTNNAFSDKAKEVQLNGVNDTIVTNNGETYVKVSPRQPQVAASKSIAASKEKRVAPHTQPGTERSTPRSREARTSGSENGTVSTSPSENSHRSDTTSTTATTKKKGWSKAAKGAVIGAGTGAAAGAIISKKKGKGAIVGGIIGAAGGYIIGRSKDKKDGRY